MRRLGLLIAVFAFGLIIACGGGDDDNGDGGDGGNGGGGNNEPSAGASSNDSGNDGDNNDDDEKDNDGGSSGNGSNSNFCSPDATDVVFDSLDFTSLDPANLRDQFEQLDDALANWEDNAPNEIEDDVRTLVGGMRGLIEILEENDFNFLAVGTTAANDPRFLALDDPKFEEAADRISDYCGIDNTNPVTSGGSTGSGGSGGGGSTGGFTVDLPDDFPAELVPPDSTLGFAGNVGFGLTVEFTSDATADEMKDYYEAELGAPTFADSESILWSVGARTVTISGTDGDLTIVIIILDS